MKTTAASTAPSAGPSSNDIPTQDSFVSSLPSRWASLMDQVSLSSYISLYLEGPNGLQCENYEKCRTREDIGKRFKVLCGLWLGLAIAHSNARHALDAIVPNTARQNAKVRQSSSWYSSLLIQTQRLAGLSIEPPVTDIRRSHNTVRKWTKLKRLGIALESRYQVLHSITRWKSFWHVKCKRNTA